MSDGRIGTTGSGSGPGRAALIEVRNLSKHFPVRTSLFGAARAWNRAVDGIDFDVREGETFSLVGESGCGKSTTSRLILRLESPTAGSIWFAGKDIAALGAEELRAFRRQLQAVLQDPTSSLSPRMRINEIVGEPIIANEGMRLGSVRDRVAKVLSEVGLPSDSATRFPHEFSGGQRQRIAIARALVADARCIILDEPVSSLDLSIRAQILNLLRKLQVTRGLTYILISHDLAAVRYLSTRIGVMYLGRLVEIADTEAVYAKPVHPYTRALLSAALPARPRAMPPSPGVTGELPNAVTPPSGCRFHPRCAYAAAMCRTDEPQLQDVGDGRRVACHRAHEIATVRPADDLQST